MRAQTKTDAAPARATPFLKWAGGKRQLAGVIGDRIYDLLSQTGGRYFEPFLGGAAMALHLGWPRMVLSDYEHALIETYVTVALCPAEVEAILREMGAHVDRPAFELVRKAEPVDQIDRAARFIYLNRLCFNGLYRVNGKGKFNVPYGRHVRPPNMPIDAMKRAASILKYAQLYHSDFGDVIEMAEAGDLIYADPPYDGTYKSYTSAGFTVEDQRRLVECLADAADRGVVIVASNRDTDLIRDLYSWARRSCRRQRPTRSRPGAATEDGSSAC
jgi:DNA adenine methylase